MWAIAATPGVGDTSDAACGRQRGSVGGARRRGSTGEAGSTRLAKSSGGDNRRLGTTGAALAGAALLPNASEGMTGARGTTGGVGVGKLPGAAGPSSPLSLVDGEVEPASERSESDPSEEPCADAALGGRAPKPSFGIIRFYEVRGRRVVGWAAPSDRQLVLDSSRDECSYAHRASLSLVVSL